VIAENIKELSNNELILENPDELINTNQILRTIGQNKKNTRTNNNYKSKKKRYKR
jgi:hypothetical protein